MKILLSIVIVLTMAFGIAWALLMHPTFGIFAFLFMGLLFFLTFFADDLDTHHEI